MEFFKTYLENVEKQYEYTRAILAGVQKEVEKSIDNGFKQLKTLVK